MAHDSPCDDRCERDPFCMLERATLVGPPPEGVVGDATTTRQIVIGAAAGVMRPLWRKRVPCIGRACDNVLVSGKVLADSFNLQAQAPIGIVTFDEDASSSAIEVKIRVQRCNHPGWVYIDADSHVVMPGGDDLEIQVIAPQFWLAVPTEQDPFPFEPPVTIHRVEVRLRACLLPCGERPRGRLTWFGSLLDGAAPMLRPPRATELFISGGVAGTPANTSWFWQDLGGLAFIGGAFTVNGTFVNALVYPGAGEQLVHVPAGVAHAVKLVWTIE